MAVDGMLQGMTGGHNSEKIGRESLTAERMRGLNEKPSGRLPIKQPTNVAFHVLVCICVQCSRSLSRRSGVTYDDLLLSSAPFPAPIALQVRMPPVHATPG